MTDQNLPQVGSGGFENLKKVNDYGAEYWSARDLQPLLGYSQWRRFENAIKKAITSCEQSGNEPSHHFAGAGKVVGIGSEASRKVPDFQLSRFACYLIAQNGDPRKPEIANAQQYFARVPRACRCREAFISCAWEPHAGITPCSALATSSGCSSLRHAAGSSALCSIYRFGCGRRSKHLARANVGKSGTRRAVLGIDRTIPTVGEWSRWLLLHLP
jgi:hypothetical protein